MVFVKPQKSRAYFKRFQVKFRRRRAGKTDYRARIRLINQDKNKYGTTKYRFVVRFTNKDVIAQIVSTSIAGDMILASAYAHELPRYGLEVGLTNYAAAYCTGLLLARRVLKTLEMDEEYEGNVEATGEDFSIEPTNTRRPFRAVLDVGLIRTTTGNRVFGALKGALDGGLDIPHSDKRFAGFIRQKKQLDAKVHRKYVYGGHVAEYMRALMEDKPEKYQTHFCEYIKRGIEADGIMELYKKVHAAIRADPAPKKSEKQPCKQHKRYNLKKLTYDERKNKLAGALDGDLDILYSDKRFAGHIRKRQQLEAKVLRKYVNDGYVPSKYIRKRQQLEAEVLREYVNDGYVPSKYKEALIEKYQTVFGEYIKRTIEAEMELVKAGVVHAAIRADPAPEKSEKQPCKQHKRYNLKKLTYDERKNELIERLNAFNNSAGADDYEESDVDQSDLNNSAGADYMKNLVMIKVQGQLCRSR